MRSPLLFCVLILVGLTSSASFAKPLTIEDIQKAKRIALMPGTFDPVTQGHIAAASAAADKGGLDLVILTPQENPHKSPIARASRLKMIDLAAHDLDKIAYAKEGGDLYSVFQKGKIWNIAGEIRKINPAIEIDLVAGMDFASNRITTILFKYTARPDGWVIVSRAGDEGKSASRTVLDARHQMVDMEPVDASSSGAKAYLLSHLELYAQNPEEVQASVPGIVPAVEKYILANDFYRFPIKPTCEQALISLLWKK